MGTFRSPACRCDVIGCNAIQIWSAASTRGITRPQLTVGDVADWTHTAGDDAPPSVDRTTWTQFIAEIRYAAFDAPLGCLGAFDAASYFPAGRFNSGRDIANAFVITCSSDFITLVEEYAAEISGVIDYITGFMTALNVTTDLGSYAWSMSLVDGSVIESGDPAVVLDARNKLQFVSDRLAEEPVIGDYSYYATEVDHLSGMFKRDSVFGGTARIDWTLGGHVPAASEAEARAVAAVHTADFTTRAAPGGVCGTDGNFVGTTMEFNQCYSLVDSIDFSITFAGSYAIQEVVETTSEPFFSVFPRRMISVLTTGIPSSPFLIEPSNEIGTQSYSLSQVGYAGKNYFGKWYDCYAPPADFNFLIVYAARCFIEVSGTGTAAMNRRFVLEQSPPDLTSSLMTWPATDAVDAGACWEYFLPVGRHILNPEDMIFDWGCGIIQRRTFYDKNPDYAAAIGCYTFPDYSLDGDGDPINVSSGRGWFSDQCPSFTF